MKPVIRAVFLFGFLILSAAVAYPCTCLKISHRKEFRQAAAVFAGQVISITEDKSYVPPKLNARPYLQKKLDERKRLIVKFSVEREFKGIRGKEISLFTYEDNMPCSGMSFANSEGQKFLVYAHRDEEGFVIGGLCSRTRDLNVNSKEYKELSGFASGRAYRFRRNRAKR